MLKNRLETAAQRGWRWMVLAAAAAIALSVAIPLTLQGENQGNTLDKQPKKLTLKQQDHLPPVPAIRAANGDTFLLLTTVGLYIAIENAVAGGYHIDVLLEHWNEVDLCRLSWPREADVFQGNDAIHSCVANVLQKARKTAPGDPYDQDIRLQGAYGALHEVTITTLDPASWHPQLATITAPCRAGYRAYVRTVHTPLVDRMSVWEFVKDQFNVCILQTRKDAVEPTADTPPTDTPQPQPTPLPTATQEPVQK